MNFNVGGYLKNRFEQASRCNDQYKDTGMTWIEKLIKSLEKLTPFTDVNAHISKRKH